MESRQEWFKGHRPGNNAARDCPRVWGIFMIDPMDVKGPEQAKSWRQKVDEWLSEAGRDGVVDGTAFLFQL